MQIDVGVDTGWDYVHNPGVLGEVSLVGDPEELKINRNVNGNGYGQVGIKRQFTRTIAAGDNFEWTLYYENAAAETILVLQEGSDLPSNGNGVGFYFANQNAGQTHARNYPHDSDLAISGNAMQSAGPGRKYRVRFKPTGIEFYLDDVLKFSSTSTFWLGKTVRAFLQTYYNNPNVIYLTAYRMWDQDDSSLEGINDPPDANAGRDQTVPWPTNIASLSGSATDPDTDPGELTFLWTVIDSPMGAIVSFVDDTDPNTFVEVDTEGDYVFDLAVSDGEFTVHDEVSIGFHEPPPPPPPEGQAASVIIAQLMAEGGGSAGRLFHLNGADGGASRARAFVMTPYLGVGAGDGQGVQFQAPDAEIYIRVPLITSGGSVQGERYARIYRNQKMRRL